MSDVEDDDSFLSRWSRRKVAAREGEPLPEAPPAEPVAAAPAESAIAASPAKAELPPVESLEGLKSDYRAFMQPGVDEGVKRAAIKKLFADPHFNVMDGLDVYIDDYTQFEPLAPGMLGRIAAVKHLFRAPESEQWQDVAEGAGEQEPAPRQAIPESEPMPADVAAASPIAGASETIRPDAAKEEPEPAAGPASARNRAES